MLYWNIFSKNRLKVSQAPHIRYLYVYFLLSTWTKTSKTGSRSDSTKITLDSQPIDSLFPAKTWFRSYVEARTAESKETTTWKTRTNNEGTNRLCYSCLTKRMRILSLKLYFYTLTFEFHFTFLQIESKQNSKILSSLLNATFKF